MRVVLKIVCAFAAGAAALRVSKTSNQSSISKVVDVPGQQFKVHYPASAQDSCRAVLFSVGTSTQVKGYDSMAAALVEKKFVVAIVDPEKGWPFKLNVKKLGDAYALARAELLSWSDGACGSISMWLVGGHSAGGGTAHKVLAADPSLADGIFSVDPFARGVPKETVNLPGLYWGFAKTTCGAKKDEAAAAFYGLTETDKRIFVRAHEEYEQGCRNPTYHHCSIVDGGCIACSTCGPTPDFFFPDVANTVQTFSDAFSKTSWADVSLETSTPIDEFVGVDL